MDISAMVVVVTGQAGGGGGVTQPVKQGLVGGPGPGQVDGLEPAGQATEAGAEPGLDPGTPDGAGGEPEAELG
ncbi:MAG: hypothetical protein ACRD0E_02875, partial [Acidimicrobiales bacterium]